MGYNINQENLYFLCHLYEQSLNKAKGGFYVRDFKTNR